MCIIFFVLFLEDSYVNYRFFVFDCDCWLRVCGVFFVCVCVCVCMYDYLIAVLLIKTLACVFMCARVLMIGLSRQQINVLTANYCS